MRKMSKTILAMVLASFIVAWFFPPVHAKGSAQIKIEGAYEAVLTLPQATPTAILTFCPDGDSFTGAWVEDGGNKFCGEMTNPKVNGDELSFSISVGPGKWDFVCTINGESIEGTVTGDGATTNFDGKRVDLEKEYCVK